MDVYIFQAALYCEDCGQAMRDEMQKPQGEDGQDYDSNDYPCGPYSDGGGEADRPNHCDGCGEFLENPLTQHGQDYVIAAWRKHKTKITRLWHNYYDYLWDSMTGRAIKRLQQ